MSSPAPVAPQATPAQKATPACMNTSAGSVASCLCCAIVCALIGNYGVGKSNSGGIPAMGLFIYFLAACYCLSFMCNLYSYFFSKPCPTQ